MWAVYIETRLLYLPDGPSTVIPNSSESVTGDLAPLGFATITPLWPPKRFSRCWLIWPEHGRNQTKECRMEWKSTRWLPELGWWDLHINEIALQDLLHWRAFIAGFNFFLCRLCELPVYLQIFVQTVHLWVCVASGSVAAYVIYYLFRVIILGQASVLSEPHPVLFICRTDAYIYII